MPELINVFGFLAVLLRGLNLALSSLVIGGLFFGSVILRPAQGPIHPSSIAQRSRSLVRNFALALAATQTLWVSLNTALLMDTLHLSLLQVAGANFFLSGAVVALSALAIAAYISLGRPLRPFLLLGSGVLIIGANVATTHALARTENTPLLLFLTAIHHAATAVWAGALPFWVLSLQGANDFEYVQILSRRFSRTAVVSFTCLVLAGIALSLFYVGSPAALYGTNYGLMVGAKIILTALVVLLAAFNHRLVRSSTGERISLLARLRTFGEAETGIAFTVILAAASLTSQPPAVDLTADRVSLQIIAARMTPQLPTLQTPPLSSLSPSVRQTWKEQHPPQKGRAESFVLGLEPTPPSTPGDIAWSEYNHHWAGIIVLAMGILAVLSRTGLARWARHWPLAFLGLGVFLLIRADADGWPLGPDGFWEGFQIPDVAQHRLFVVLIALFAFFEWGVQTGRLRSAKAALVFPGVCAAGGALLMTHTHALSNIQEELLAEFSHLPLAILGVVAGWSRWLELRLPSAQRLIPSRIWPVCFVLIGVVLLLYREA